ncbi:hypothetical protein [Anaerocolumna jejuensis]
MDREEGKKTLTEQEDMLHEILKQNKIIYSAISRAEAICDVR